MLGGVMAVVCFISHNPSPLRWMVSGSPSDVAALERTIRSTPNARVVALAVDGSIAFARFELDPRMLYGDYMGLLNRAAELGVMSAVEPATPSCAEGRREDVGNIHARPVIVGIFGDTATLATIRGELGWASLSQVQSEDGRQGLAFEPKEDQAAAYEAFVARSAKGEWPAAEVVLVQRKAPAPSVRRLYTLSRRAADPRAGSSRSAPLPSVMGKGSNHRTSAPAACEPRGTTSRRLRLLGSFRRGFHLSARLRRRR